MFISALRKVSMPLLVLALASVTFLGGFASQVRAETDSFVVSAPSGFTATPVGESQINLSWNAAVVSNNSTTSTSSLPTIDTYAIYRDSNQIATTTALTYFDMGLTTGTQYSYNVMARDMLGNISPLTAPVMATTWNAATSTPTTTPPTATTTPPTSTTTPPGNPWDSNMTATLGWAAIPQNLFNQIWGSGAGTTTPGNSTITYDANGYPMWNGSYINCEGQIDNDPAHHVVDPNDTDPAHNVGKNCPGGAPKTPSMSSVNWAGSAWNNMGMPFTVWVGSGAQASYWVVIPLNVQTLEQLLGKVK